MSSETIHYGRFVVADPAVQGGALTFKGSQVLVADVLDDVANELSWEAIVEKRQVRYDAITEAVLLAREALLEKAEAENTYQPIEHDDPTPLEEGRMPPAHYGETIHYGQYVVADARICHGRLPSRGPGSLLGTSLRWSHVILAGGRSSGSGAVTCQRKPLRMQCWYLVTSFFRQQGSSSRPRLDDHP